MQNASFQFTIKSVETVNCLPTSWPADSCTKLLERLEFPDISTIETNQLFEYAVMALQDLEAVEAARTLLDHLFGKTLSDGKKQNLSEEMMTERPWEEYPDLSFHERIFIAQQLLNQAFPETPLPEINHIEAELSSLNQAAEATFSKYNDTLPEWLIARCIAACPPDDTILNRLFEDQIAGDPFPDAEHLVWQIQTSSLAAEGPKKQRRQLSLYSPIRWTSDLEEGLSVNCQPSLEH